MLEYNCMAEFAGLTLIIPDKSDVERDAVANAWEEHGGQVIKIERHAINERSIFYCFD